LTANSWVRTNSPSVIHASVPIVITGNSIAAGDEVDGITVDSLSVSFRASHRGICGVVVEISNGCQSSDEHLAK